MTAVLRADPQPAAGIRAFARFIAWPRSRTYPVERQYPCMPGRPRTDRLLSKTEMKDLLEVPAAERREAGSNTPCSSFSTTPGHASPKRRSRGRRSANRTTRRRASARQHPRQGRKTPTVSAVAPDRSRAHRALAGTGSRGAVFLSRQRRAYTRFGVYRLVERSAARVPSLAGRRITPHTIRHTSACHLPGRHRSNTIRAWLVMPASIRNQHHALDHGDEWRSAMPPSPDRIARGEQTRDDAFLAAL